MAVTGRSGTGDRRHDRNASHDRRGGGGGGGGGRDPHFGHHMGHRDSQSIHHGGQQQGAGGSGGGGGGSGPPPGMMSGGMGSGVGGGAVPDDSFVSKFQTLEEVVGQLMSVAQDQNGCRFLQRKFDEGGPAVGLGFGVVWNLIGGFRVQGCVEPHRWV